MVLHRRPVVPRVLPVRKGRSLSVVIGRLRTLNSRTEYSISLSLRPGGRLANTSFRTRDVTQAVSDLQTTIINGLNAKFTADQLVAEKDTEVQGIPPDNYVSAFAGYHAVWYDAWKESCKAGWHTHVGYGMTTATATQAIKLQLDELIKWLNTQ